MARSRKAPVPNQDLLSPEEIAEIRKMAVDGEAKRRRDTARADLLKQFEAEEKAKGDPDEDIIRHQLELPASAMSLLVDGVQYFHGQTYEFGRKFYNSVREMEQRAWQHEEVTFGHRNPNAYRRPLDARFGEMSRANDFMQPRI